MNRTDETSMDGSLNILVINWQDISNPLAGGAEVHLHEVFERLAARGHRITLLCHRFRGSTRRETRNGLTIIRVGHRLLFNFIVPWYYFFRLRHRRYDVVVDDVNKIPFFTPLFVRRPIQGITHHLFGKSIFLETAFPIALYVYLSERLIRSVYRDVHFIIGSPSTHQEYIQWGFPPEQVPVVNYCVNHDTYRPDPTGLYDAHLIGYFGRLKKYKSVDHLLRAFARLRASHPTLHLQIIGDGDDKLRLMDLAGELGLGDSVSFLGFVPEQEKAPLLQRMNFVVNTSSKEGWGLTVVEANACGTPVIAADVQGLRDSVIDGRTGMLYPYGDIEILTSRMDLLLRDAMLRERFREEALAWANSFHWEKAADQTIAYIRATIDRFHREREGHGGRH